ncbi:MAG: TerB family tellurite resistance protein [Candidatus Aureabacteria bacterium]|nr:TerB family tellurite resistance protein [Candidatus Auribacterota bacterium]
MSEKDFMINLAKVIIAASWVDGNISNDEINSLKDLIFNLPGITGKDWTQLSIYIDSPVEAEERERLIKALVDNIKSEKDKDIVIGALDSLVNADGKVTDNESKLLNDVRSVLDKKQTGIIPFITDIMKKAVNSRRKSVMSGPNREERIEDFIKNKIYYSLVTDLASKGIKINIPESKIKKLCLTAGLMARIAWVDKDITDDEKKIINKILIDHYKLSDEEALLITQISLSNVIIGLDYYRLTRSFYEVTTVEERILFLEILFLVAAADEVSYDETEEIRKISNALKLSHKDFIAAKLLVIDK